MNKLYNGNETCESIFIGSMYFNEFIVKKDGKFQEEESCVGSLEKIIIKMFEK